MGRIATWHPRKITHRDVIRGQAIRAAYGPNLRTEKRVKLWFAEFCRLNRASAEDLFLPFLGQMLNSGLSAGTAKDYMMMVTRCRRSEAAYLARKSAEAHHTASRTGHAADVGLPHAQAVISRLSPGLIRSACWLMLATGARCTDISRLRRRNIIHLNKRSLNVLFQWTKGIKKMKHRRELEYPLEGVGDAPVELLKLLKSKRSNDFLFDKLTPAMVNKQLRATETNEKTTTGSFRRLFAKRIRNHCAKKKISVSSMMLHISAEMVSGFYDIGNKN
jgi:hypothetical protein